MIALGIAIRRQNADRFVQQPRRNMSLAMQHPSHIDVIGALDMESQIGVIF